MPSGLPEMTGAERVRAELEVLGLDASRHVLDFYAAVARRARRHPGPRPAAPAQPGRAAGRRGQGRHPDPADPVRAAGSCSSPSTTRTGPVDATFFEDAQGPYAATRVPLLAARGPRGAAAHRPARGVAAGHRVLGAADAVRRLAGRRPRRGRRGDGQRRATVDRARPVAGAAESRSPPAGHDPAGRSAGEATGRSTVWRRPATAIAAARARRPAAWAAGAGTRRVLVHPSGFRQSPYADVKPPGDDATAAARKAAREPRPRRASCGTPVPGSSGG